VAAFRYKRSRELTGEEVTQEVRTLIVVVIVIIVIVVAYLLLSRRRRL
jgi:hypothetical protein